MENGNHAAVSDSIRIGEKDYRIRFTMAEAMRYEEETGKSLFSGQAFSDNSAKNVLRLLLAAVRPDAADVTMDVLAESLNFEDLPRVLSVMVGLFLKMQTQAKKNGLLRENASPETSTQEAEQIPVSG